MTATSHIQTSIAKAIGAHGMWKTRLHDAIELGKSDFTVEAVTKDNNCEFGKWLYGAPELKASAHYQKVRALHADFHKEVGRILALAISGKKAEALKAMDSGTVYIKLSADLTAEMIAWSKE